MMITRIDDDDHRLWSPSSSIMMVIIVHSAITELIKQLYTHCYISYIHIDIKMYIYKNNATTIILLVCNIVLYVYMLLIFNINKYIWWRNENIVKILILNLCYFYFMKFNVHTINKILVWYYIEINIFDSTIIIEHFKFKKVKMRARVVSRS